MFFITQTRRVKSGIKEGAIKIEDRPGGDGDRQIRPVYSIYTARGRTSSAVALPKSRAARQKDSRRPGPRVELYNNAHSPREIAGLLLHGLGRLFSMLYRVVPQGGEENARRANRRSANFNTSFSLLRAS